MHFEPFGKGPNVENHWQMPGFSIEKQCLNKIERFRSFLLPSRRLVGWVVVVCLWSRREVPPWELHSKTQHAWRRYRRCVHPNPITQHAAPRSKNPYFRNRKHEVPLSETLFDWLCVHFIDMSVTAATGPSDMQTTSSGIGASSRQRLLSVASARLYRVLVPQHLGTERPGLSMELLPPFNPWIRECIIQWPWRGWSSATLRSIGCLSIIAWQNGIS